MIKLYDMKLGEETKDKGILMDILEAPAKLVKITYTFQDKEGVTLNASLIHKDCIEHEDASADKSVKENK